MFNKLIAILFMSVMGAVQGLALDQMLEVNNQNVKKRFRITYWTMLGILSAIANVLTNNQIPALQFGIYGIGVVLPILYFYKDPIWRRILAFFLMVVGLTSAEMLVMLIVKFTNVDVGIFYDRTKSIVVFCIGVGNIFAIFVISIIVVVWKKLFYRRSRIKYFWFFLAYVFNYFVTLAFMEVEFRSLNVGTSEFWPVLTSIICEIALLFIIFSQSEKESMEQSLSDEKIKIELEKLHYSEMEKRRLKILEISQDHSGQMETAKEFLNNNQTEAAKTELAKLLEKVEKTREYAFCNIPIVNAILSEKIKECEENRIILETNLQIDEKITIKQLDLCSVFSNMLDNAIRACKQVNRNNLDKMVHISLNAAMKSNYLVIKCSNPIISEPGKYPEGTGYGLKIMTDIAKRYEGNVRVDYDNQKYEIVVVLKN